mmetsp:Transcript_9077/g.13748  ORF Transcript_9077/g.13748 Transcript_9077/m.13748 type:complete len:231 (-) Transcript_9077:153-845(-)
MNLSKLLFQVLEYNIFIILCVKSSGNIFFLANLGVALLLRCIFKKILLDLGLFFTLHKLKTSEIFSLQLIKFTLNIIKNNLDLGNSHILKRINTPIGNLHCLVKSHKTCLQTSKLNQLTQENSKFVPYCYNLLSSTNKPKRLIISYTSSFVNGKNWQFHSSNIINSSSNTNTGSESSLSNLLFEVSCSIFSLSKGKESGCCVTRHVTLCLCNHFSIIAEFHLERISLFLQ